jgi:hypothetical protein
MGWTPKQFTAIKGIIDAHIPGASLPPCSPQGLEFLKSYEAFLHVLESTSKCDFYLLYPYFTGSIQDALLPLLPPLLPPLRFPLLPPLRGPDGPHCKQ